MWYLPCQELVKSAGNPFNVQGTGYTWQTNQITAADIMSHCGPMAATVMQVTVKHRLFLPLENISIIGDTSEFSNQQNNT